MSERCLIRYGCDKGFEGAGALGIQHDHLSNSVTGPRAYRTLEDVRETSTQREEALAPGPQTTPASSGKRRRPDYRLDTYILDGAGGHDRHSAGFDHENGSLVIQPNIDAAVD